MHNGTYRGFVEGQPGYPGALRSVVGSGKEGIAAAHAALSSGSDLDPEEIRFLPVIPEPLKILCVGLNYRDHAKESGFQPPAYPTIFSRFATSLIGHDEPLIRPRVSDSLDFEGELAVIIGHGGRRIPEARALDHVAGYSIFNDGSVREYQHKTPQWTLGKNFDRTGSFGPVFVTADELPAGGSGLKIETRLNGATVQSSNTADMVFGVPTLIAVISEAMTLQPGDVIVSGTPSGVGHARTPRLYMKHGDVCEVEIEGLGILRNRIEDEAALEARSGYLQ